MAVWIKDKNAVPPEGFKFPHVAPREYIRSPNYDLLYRRVVEAYTSNGKTPPTQEEVDEWLCKHTTIDCRENGQPVPNRYTHTAPSEQAVRTCIHRGEVVAKEQCATCGGKVMAFIHACTIHGRCTMFHKDVGVTSCWDCRDCVGR